MASVRYHTKLITWRDALCDRRSLNNSRLVFHHRRLPVLFLGELSALNRSFSINSFSSGSEELSFELLPGFSSELLPELLPELSSVCFLYDSVGELTAPESLDWLRLAEFRPTRESQNRLACRNRPNGEMVGSRKEQPSDRPRIEAVDEPASDEWTANS